MLLDLLTEGVGGTAGVALLLVVAGLLALVAPRLPVLTDGSAGAWTAEELRRLRLPGSADATPWSAPLMQVRHMRSLIATIVGLVAALGFLGAAYASRLDLNRQIERHLSRIQGLERQIDVMSQEHDRALTSIRIDGQRQVEEARQLEARSCLERSETGQAVQSIERERMLLEVRRVEQERDFLRLQLEDLRTRLAACGAPAPRP